MHMYTYTVSASLTICSNTTTQTSLISLTIFTSYYHMKRTVRFIAVVFATLQITVLDEILNEVRHLSTYIHGVWQVRF